MMSVSISSISFLMNRGTTIFLLLLLSPGCSSSDDYSSDDASDSSIQGYRLFADFLMSYLLSNNS